MATDLVVYGPFPIEYDESNGIKRITGKHESRFWKVSAVQPLMKKRGCYVFAVRAAKGFKPWYVGKTNAGKGFKQECFTSHKLNHYNDALFRGGKGRPVLFFVAPPNKKNVVPTAELDHMEKELIQYGIRKNPDLCNVQNTKNVPQWTIKGVIRSPRGKPAAAARSFRTMMKM